MQMHAQCLHLMASDLPLCMTMLVKMGDNSKALNAGIPATVPFMQTVLPLDS